MAFGAMVALARRAREGGSWLVRTSLAQTGRWLSGLGQVRETQLTHVPEEFTPEEITRWSMMSETPMGRLSHLVPAVRLSETPPRWARPSVPLGYHEPVWPTRATYADGETLLWRRQKGVNASGEEGDRLVLDEPDLEYLPCLRSNVAAGIGRHTPEVDRVSVHNGTTDVGQTVGPLDNPVPTNLH